MESVHNTYFGEQEIVENSSQENASTMKVEENPYNGSSLKNSNRNSKHMLKTTGNNNSSLDLISSEIS
jgi:hypothetical protein